jgi:hypothetical protein
MNKAEAERQIAAILKRLEEETDQVVDGLYLHTTCISTLDKPDLHQRSVKIELHRQPDNDWVT